MRKTDDFLGQILDYGPSQSTLLLLLTKLKQEGRSGEVVRECVRALNSYPEDIPLRKLLAEAYLDMGFVGQAENELERVREGICKLSSAYKLLAKIYLRQGRVVEASNALDQYLKLSPDDEEAIDLIEEIRYTEPATDAPIYTEVADLLPEEDTLAELATPTLAEIYYKQGQIDEAIDTYEKVLAGNPSDEHSLQRLSELKRLATRENKPAPLDEAGNRQKKERMITVLEGWLSRIQESGIA